MPYGGGRGGFRKPFRSFGPREMHKITCSECGKEDEVPFKPREGTPVFCKECFMKKKGIKPRTEQKSEESEVSEEAEESEESEQ
jgi:CxxC-x17-CxxC domain-containing protein